MIPAPERPMHRAARPAWAIATIAAMLALAVGCSSSDEGSDATLPPLVGGPTTLALPGITTTTVAGATTVATAGGDSASTAATTAPPTTPPSTAVGAVGGWGGWAYYEVPQLGSEPVRGSGCGANGSLGEVVPDGVWNVNVGDGSGASRFWSNGTISLDLRCVYAGEAGRAQWNTVCSAAPQADACQSQSPDWFVVNVNSRLRTMPVASSVAYGVGALGSTPCPGVSVDPTAGDAPWRFMDSWVVVDGGVVTAVIAACPAG